MNFYYMGYKTTARPDFEQFLAEPKAPKNYKSTEAINDYLDKARAEMAQTASSKPFTSIISEVTVFSTNCRDKSLEEVGKFSGEKAAYDLASFIEGLSRGDSQVCALNVNNFIRSLCVQVIQEKHNFDWVYMYLYKYVDVKDLFVDPTRLFLPSVEEQSRISLPNLFKYFNVDLTDADLMDTAKQAMKLHEFSVATGIDCGRISNHWQAQ
jgi:hypothetical protein